MKNGAIFLDSAVFFDIGNLTIRGSSESGIRVLNHSNNITLSNCTIENNKGYGLAVFTSGITVSNCRILNNGEGGIQFNPSPTDFRLNLNNVLIAKNSGIGISLTSPLADLKFVTISHNDSDGICIVSPSHSFLSIFSSIISFNRGFGIFRQDDSGAEGSIEIGPADLFGNSLGNLSDGMSGAFLSIDPNFTDTLQNDYSIAPSGEIFNLETEGLIFGYR
jgi:parallel beta-helix repeat protein